MWLSGHKDINAVETMYLEKRDLLLKKECPGFFWDFCVWSYRASQKKGQLIFLLTLVLRFYGLALQGLYYNVNFTNHFTGLTQLHTFRITLTSKTFLLKYSQMDDLYSKKVK